MVTFSEAAVQDLAELLTKFVCSKGKCHQDMDQLAKRFGVDPRDTFSEKSSAIGTRTYEFLSLLNRTSTILDVLSYVIARHVGPDDSALREAYERILKPFGFEIKIEGAICRLIGTGIKQEEAPRILSWLEQNAPQDTQGLLSSAKEGLGEGRFDDVLHYCRKALESLTAKGAFSEALSELVSSHLIQKGDRADRKMEMELLQAAYGYCSTLGSHAGPHKADLEHARLAISITESAIYFLLKRISTYRQNGGQLQYWR